MSPDLLGTLVFNRLLLAPTRAELAEALAAAAATLPSATGPLRDRDALARFEAEAEGVWVSSRRRPGRGAGPTVAVAWWRDFAGRAHVRVSNGGPWPPRPPLLTLYPEQTLARGVGPDAVPLCLCACGAWGEPRSLGWMGDRCGPCFDRGDQAPQPAGWVLPRPAAAATLSPDGLALGALGQRGEAGSEIAVFDAATGRATPAFTVETPAPGGLFLLGPRAARLAVVRYETAWVTTDLHRADGRRLARLAETGGVAFPPSGDGLVTWGRGGLAWRSGPRASPVLFGPSSLENNIARFAPDGRRLATRTIDFRTVAIWDVTSRRMVGHYQPRGLVSPPCFTPDGRALCLAYGGDSVGELCAVGPGRALRPAPWPATLGVPWLSCAFDGRWVLACGPGVFLVLRLNGNGPDFEGVPGVLSVCGFLADGRLLTLSWRDGRVRLWPAELFHEGRR
jgi:hypothetical protein